MHTYHVYTYICTCIIQYDIVHIYAYRWTLSHVRTSVHMYDTHSTYSGSGISTVGVACSQCVHVYQALQTSVPDCYKKPYIYVDVNWNVQCDRKSLSHYIRSHKCACNDKAANRGPHYYCQLGVCLVPTTTVSWVSVWSPLLLSVGRLFGPHYYCQLGVCLVPTTTVSWVSVWSPLLLSVGCLFGPH